MLAGAVAAIADFHDKFDIPIFGTPFEAPMERRLLRLDLIHEEVSELDQAMRRGDMISIADGMGDVIYVVIGAALEYGIPIDAVFREIHRSNMTKVWADGSVHRRIDGKILKPETYSPADLRGVLYAHGMRTIN